MEHTIVRLPESTIQKIAAGEVITRPTNVIKELLENSIDAGAQNIRIIIDQGGLKLIEVIDNGHGIAKSNAQIVCQRYTTSKITSVNDLNRISTFGFRGEALASISEVADLEIISFNISADTMGWTARFRHGQPVESIADKYVQLAGTQIRVTNLFSDSLPRKNTLATSFLDEKKAIVDLITKFTIHHRERITLILSDKVSGELICSIAPISIGPCIGSFYGVEMETNLIDFSIEHHQSFEASIYVAFSYKKSNANIQQSNMILFVNNRLVECDELRREISALIIDFLGMKQLLSLVYISLRVPSYDVDVNCHPAKATVTMHYQQEITVLILTEMRSRLQDKLSCSIVKTSASQITIGELIKHRKSSQSETASPDKSSQENQQRLRVLAPGSIPRSQPFVESSKRAYDQVHIDHTQPEILQLCSRVPPSRFRRDLKLKSISDLMQKVALEKSDENLSLIRSSVFVGIYDHDHALIQNDTRLFAINLKAFFKELCYQLYLYDFGNFPPIEILPPGNKIHHMIDTYLKDAEVHDIERFKKFEFNTPDLVLDRLMSHNEMLKDYLSLEFTRLEILTLPNIVYDHIPNLINLGRFFVDLANVDYSEERACFHKIGRVIADFYSEPPANLSDNNVHLKYHNFMKSTIYDAIKRLLLPPDWLFTKENICQITDTKDLYKVFERC